MNTRKKTMLLSLAFTLAVVMAGLLGGLSFLTNTTRTLAATPVEPVRGSVGNDDKFKMSDATTTEDNGKRVKAKPGYELVSRKNNQGVEARRSNRTTVSSDSRICTCTDLAPGQAAHCSFSLEGQTAICGGSDSSACCKWVSVNK
jgi:hypothetical protein